MREILFRGKRVDNDEWAYGYLVEATNVITDKKATFIFEQDATYFTHGEFACSFEVKPETVGQYTGLKDKNRKKIFEGDIVRYETIAHNGYEGIYKVVFEDRNGCGYFGIAYSDIETCFFCYSAPASQMEVIGNIYDGKELLEDEE